MNYALFLAFCFLLSPLMAMEGDNHGNHGALKQWFNELRSDKGPCCSFADGYTITDADWESVDGHYRVRIPRYKPSIVSGDDMIWVDVPDDAVIKEPNRLGPTVVWPLYNTGSHPAIRCFLPGIMS
jgi:hypothetical protein